MAAEKKNAVVKRGETKPHKKQNPARKTRVNPALWWKNSARFLREVVVELKRTNWPTRKDFASSCVAVLLFVVVMMVVVFIMDSALTRGLRVFLDALG